MDVIFYVWFVRLQSAHMLAHINKDGAWGSSLLSADLCAWSDLVVLLLPR